MTRLTRLIDGALEGGLLVLLLLAPLPRGSVGPAAQIAIEGGVALLVALWLVRQAVAGEAELRLSPLLWPAVAMAGLVTWHLLRPGALVSPYATWESARLYGAYLGLLLVVSGLSLTRARVARLMVALVVWAVLLAGVGFARQLGVDAVWPVPSLEVTSRLTSTFVNPNHQALYFSLALFATVGLLLRPAARGPRWEREGARPRSRPGPAGSLQTRVLLVGAALVLALALVLTLSRGGVVSVAAGLMAMLALALSGRTRSRAVLPVLAVAFGLIAYTGWVGLESVAERFAVTVREPTSDLRWRVWGATVSAVSEAPITGVGLGAFMDGFSPYRPVEVAAEYVVDYAHNDFLQLLAETGVLGLLIGLWALVALLTFTVRRWGGRRDPFVRGFVLGGVGAVVAAMVHSLVDFGLHMPANAVVLVLIAGLLPLVVTLHQDGAGERVGLASWRVRLTGPARAMSVVGAALVVTTAAVLLVPPAFGEWHHAKANGILRGARQGGTVPTQRDLAQARDELRAAVAWNPWSPAGWADLAEVSGQLGDRAFAYGLTSTGQRIANPSVAARFDAAQPFLAEAYDAHRASLQLRPRAGAQHERMGRFLAGTEGIRRAVLPSAVKGPVDARRATLFGSDRDVRSEALGHFREAIRRDPRNAYYHRSLGLFALDVADREVAVAALREALTLRPDFLPVIVDELLARRVDDEFVRTTMPRNFEVVLDLARELGARGKLRPAATAFEDAVSLAATPAQEVEARLAYGRALLERGDPAGALEQGRRALVLAPKEAEVFVLFAAVYDRTNKDADAEMALTTAVALAEPGPAALRHRLQAELAALLSRRGQVDRATAMWRQVLRENPNDAWAHLQLGRVLEQRGDAAGALHEFRSAYAVAGEDFDLHWAVARALRDGGYLREAVGIYDAARRLRPAEGDLGAELGDLYARIGLTDRATEQYRQVLRREPDHPGARRGLASVTASAGS